MLVAIAGASEIDGTVIPEILAGAMVRTNNLVLSSLSPDVVIDGVPAASLGLRVTAVAAAF